MRDTQGKWHSVSLRLQGEHLPLEDIASYLGLSPSRLMRKGDHFNANPRYALQETNTWIWNSPMPPDRPFEEQLLDLLPVLEAHRSGLTTLLEIPDVAVEVFLGFSSENGQGGAHFSADTLRRLGMLGVGLSMDLYPESQHVGGV